MMMKTSSRRDPFIQAKRHWIRIHDSAHSVSQWWAQCYMLLIGKVPQRDFINYRMDSA